MTVVLPGSQTGTARQRPTPGQLIRNLDSRRPIVRTAGPRPRRAYAPAPPRRAGEVLVVAHRGSSATAPEHTLPAYAQAIEEGADALECDVRLTRDGVLVCVHDRRVDRTSDGRGVVSSLELAALAELDFSARADSRAADTEAADTEAADTDRFGVLTLDRLLHLVLEADRPVGLHIETKHPTRYAGRVERALVALLDRHGLAAPPDPERSRVTVMSFAATSLRRLHAYAPQLPSVLLMEQVPRWLRDGSLPPRVGVAGPSIAVLRTFPRYVARAHAYGHRVHVWTVNDPADVDLALSLGVDAVISDRPTEMLRRLGR